MRSAVFALALALPSAALAVGTDDGTSPPTPTETTQRCAEGQIWDAQTQGCVAPEDARLDDDTRYEAVRELAYAGRYPEALAVLTAMTDQTEGRVLTYLGFVHRRMGEVDSGMAYYRQALAADPDNLLARSYMGQALVEAGDTAAAHAELAEIQARGGSGSWAEIALARAISEGRTFGY
jgi:Flp pilus assembly protein TadD